MILVLLEHEILGDEEDAYDDIAARRNETPDSARIIIFRRDQLQSTLSIEATSTYYTS